MQIAGPSGLGPGARQPLAAEGLHPDHGADHVAVDVRVADAQAFVDAPDRAVDAAVNAQREAIAGAVDGLDDLIQAVGGVGDHMKDGPEHLALQEVQAVDPIDAGGEKGAVGAGLGQGRPAQQAAVAVHAPPVGLQHGQGVGVDHRPHVRGQQRRVAHRQLGGRADQHIDDAPGDVVLQE